MFFSDRNENINLWAFNFHQNVSAKQAKGINARTERFTKENNVQIIKQTFTIRSAYV